MMNAFVVLAATMLAAVVHARPEPPLSLGGGGGGGYAPPSSYGPPQPPAQQPPIYGPPPQAPTVHKHVYVHVPPPEQEEYKPPRPIEVAPPQKHYKIIFIKAPTPPTPTAPVIPLQPQNEEKTLVYVLVKKPEEQPEINIPVPQPTQPSKPEVYFIRYKTQKEQQQPGGYQASGVPEGHFPSGGGIAPSLPVGGGDGPYPAPSGPY